MRLAARRWAVALMVGVAVLAAGFVIVWVLFALGTSLLFTLVD